MIDSVLVVLASHHFNPERKYNERNLGVIVVTDKNYLVGGYKNSYNKNTALVGKQIPLTEGRVSFGIVAAAVTGYGTPLFLSGYAKTKYFQIFFVPPVPRVAPMTVAVSARIEF